MGTIGKLFPLTDYTNGTAVDQQHLFISKLQRFTVGKYLWYLSSKLLIDV
jgi:hypothetical protein